MFQSPPPSMRKMMVASPAAIEAMEEKDAAVSDYYQSKVITTVSKIEAPFGKYADWKSRHEPSPLTSSSIIISPSKSKDDANSANTAKSASSALDHILDGLTNKVVMILLDISCHLVEQVENELDSADNDDMDTCVPKSTDSQLVNALRGYLLTLRFDTTSKRANAVNVRASAIQRLTALLEQQLQRSSLRLRQETMRAALVNLDTSELIQKAWDECSKDLDSMLGNESGECKENTKGTSSSSSSTATTLVDADKLAILEIAGVSPPPSTTTADDGDARQVGSQLLGNQLMNLLKIAFSEKVGGKQFPYHLSHAMDYILCDFALYKFMPPDSPKGTGAKPVKPLKATDQMAAILDSQHQRLIASVRTEIASMMRVLDGLTLVKKNTNKEEYVGNAIGFGSAFGSGGRTNSPKFF